MGIGDALGKVQFGTLGEWASAAGAIIAVIVALGIHRRERIAAKKLELLQEKDDARQAREAREEHASLVAVWTETGYGNDYPASVNIFNGGSLPVTRVRCSTEHIDQEGEQSNAPTVLGSVNPKETRPVKLDYNEYTVGGGYSIVGFTDGRGVRWSRDTEGVLEELKSGSTSPVA